MKNFIKQLENEVACLENDYTMHPSSKAKLIKEKKRTINKLRELSYHPEVKELAEKMLKDGVIESYKVGVGVIIIDGRKEKKEVELVRGEVYNRKGIIFRYFDEKCTPLAVSSNSAVLFEDCYGFVFNDSEIATQEEKAKLIKAEEEHGKFWSDEKGDFLNLEDVYYKAETIQDLKDIIIACPVELISVGFCFHLSFNLICLDSGYNKIDKKPKINNLRGVLTNKIKVTKDVFINLLKK